MNVFSICCRCLFYLFWFLFVQAFVGKQNDTAIDDQQISWELVNYNSNKVGKYSAIWKISLREGIDPADDTVNLTVKTTVFVKADLTRYHQLLQSVKEADYTHDSWRAYQTVVNNNIVTKQSDQDDVDTGRSLFREMFAVVLF